MPRPLDHYGMDLSGFGRLARGDGESKSAVTADGGIVIPKESLFRKKINFDKDGNPLPDTANGRDLFAQLAIQKKLRESKLGDTKDILNTMSGNDIAKLKAEIEGKSNASSREIMDKFNAEKAFRDSSVQHQTGMAELDARKPHLPGISAAEALATIANSNSAARGANSLTDSYYADMRNAENRVKNATANHLNQVPIGPGGTATLDDKGGVAALFQPFNSATISKMGPSGFPEQQQVTSPASVQNSLFNTYVPGSGFHNKGNGQAATAFVPNTTTVPNVMAQRADTIAALAQRAAQQPPPSVAPTLGATAAPALGATSADYLKNLTSVAGGDASAAKLRNLFGTSAAAATGAFPEQLGSSIFKTAPNLMYNGDIKNRFDSLPDDIRQSVYNDVLRKMGIAIPGATNPAALPEANRPMNRLFMRNDGF